MRDKGRAKGVGAALALAALVVAALGVSLAAATELTRDEYTARVEPICKRNVEANKRIFKGAEAEVRAGKLKLASRHFIRAAIAFEKTIGQIEAVPQPPADEAKLAKWLRYLHIESDFVRRIGKALAAEEKRRAEALGPKLNRNSTRANNAALGFGFKYCRIDPSRFG